MKKESYCSPYNFSNACRDRKVYRAGAAVAVAFLAGPCGMARTFYVLAELLFSHKKQEDHQQS